MTLVPYSTTFDISAVTESFIVDDTSDMMTNWPFKGALVYGGFDTEGSHFQGIYRPSAHTFMEFERIGHGPLRIVCKAAQAGGSVGALVDDEGNQTALGSRVVFRLEGFNSQAGQAQSVVLPVSGRIRVGRAVRREVSPDIPILREGSIRLLGKSLWLGTIYEAGSFQLNAGDEVSTIEPRSPAQGLVMVDESPGLSVSVRVVADHASVSRFESEGYSIRSSIVSRLVNDAFVQSTWGMFLGVLALRKLVREGFIHD